MIHLARSSVASARPIFIAGGGTGGHVYPAIAIADALVAAGRAKEDIHFVGSKRGIEARVVPEAGYSITLLPGRGIPRSLGLAPVKAVAGLLLGAVKAVSLVARARPAAVVSVGGYAAAPCGLAAALLRVPLVLAESNATPGAVHRMLAPFAKSSAVAWPNTRLPHATVTGNPVRRELLAVDRSAQADAKATLGLSVDAPLVASFGGSLGARSINRAVVGLAEAWRNRDVSIYQVVGRRDWQDPALRSAVRDGVKSVEYENRMDLLYAAADIVVCRSGATTTAEIAAVGVPTIFVPLPNAPGDHQTANARVLADANAAVLLPDAECTAERLSRLVDELLRDPDRRVRMGEAATTFARLDAAVSVARLVLAAAER